IECRVLCAHVWCVGDAAYQRLRRLEGSEHAVGSDGVWHWYSSHRRVLGQVWGVSMCGLQGHDGGCGQGGVQNVLWHQRGRGPNRRGERVSLDFVRESVVRIRGIAAPCARRAVVFQHSLWGSSRGARNGANACRSQVHQGFPPRRRRDRNQVRTLHIASW
ncbi:hypothetical protein DYB37_003516, partial [Aphanomyces astaci]